MSDWSDDPVGAGLRAFLLGNATISTAVAGARIFPLRLPQKSEFKNGERSIVLSRISDNRQGHLRGPGGLAKDRYQVDVWALAHDAATALGRAIRRRIDGYQGTWTDGGSPETRIQVQAIQHEDENDLFEEEILGGLSRHSADYFVTYRLIGETILI